MLKKLYQKSELGFSLIWIGLYVILFSAADSISATLGIEKVIAAPLAIAMSFVVFFWLRRNNMLQKYGICRPRGNMRDYLYFIPLMIIVSSNAWYGFAINASILEIVLRISSMLCVGFVEEVVFRGFLFKAMAKDNVKRAIIISSVTFGIGHIVNLLNGAPMLSTMLQICYACAGGFLFVIIFYRSESLIPCILTHSALNALSVLIDTTNVDHGKEIIIAVILTIVSIAYAVYIIKRTNNQTIT